MRYLIALSLLAASWAAADPGFKGASRLDEILERAIAAGEVPGAVLLVTHEGRTVHRKAYGFRALTPARERMTADTIFDAASLTKVVATATSIAQLFEQGKIRLNDRVTEYLPEFLGGSSPITVRHLLTHFSGLRPDLDLEPAWQGYDTGIAKALEDKPVARPGERFLYSDINYILLGEIVRRVSGQPLPEYAAEHIFRPLRMRDTMFLPPASLERRIAPTETPQGESKPLRGVVHDPTTRYMGGVAGHAGMFTTADDLARFAEMILGLGEYKGVRVLQPLTVRKMTSPQSPADQPVLRGIGWDIDSQFSTNRGELLPFGSFGHTGFTGTSLWIDPVTRTAVVLLANSVHPRLRRSITALRSRVATAAAAALGIDVPGVALTSYNETLARAGTRRRSGREGEVLTGLDVLARDGFAPLRARRVGLITNHTGLSREGERNVDLLVRAGIQVTALFSPEHGIAGQADEPDVAHASDAATGIPVWSLYSGENRRPSRAMLQNIDVLVFDIQDVGARFYTYMCTMLYAMEEAARLHIPFVVLDRPNPITGVHVEGPMLEPALSSFVGCFPLPLRHGMTLGEIAAMANAERKTGAELTVIRMQGWQRGDWFDSTGLAWVNPSPNMRSLTAALLYPGVAMLEYSENYSVGRGTDSPFEQIGADWIRGPELARYLNSRKVPGVRVYPTRFRPAASRFADTLIEGIRFVVTDRDALDSARLGLELGAALQNLYPGKIDWRANARLVGDSSVLTSLERCDEPRSIVESLEDPLAAFLTRRETFLLYR